MGLCVDVRNMARVSASVSDEQAAQIEDLARSDGPYDSKSEVIRACIRAYNRVEEVEQENERLHRERRQLLEQREEHNDLVRYVEDRQKEEQRAREKEEQPIWTRATWWFFGRPTES
jgi:Arc/MetJ-type ribon-helix-helix transcriptional regulator